jgi:hypothetical protein
MDSAHKMIRTGLAGLLLAALMLAPGAAKAADVILGILEQLSPGQQKRLASVYGETTDAVVRLAFHSEGGGWKAFPTDSAAIAAFPARLAWTIALDGRARGRIESASPRQWQAYEDVGMQFLSPGSTAPRIGAPQAAYERWDADAPVRRPLVVVSAPHVADPDQWKPAAPDAALLQRGTASFLAKLAEERPALRPEPADVQLLKSYRSARGELLLAFVVQGKAPPPDEVPGPEWGPHWFVLDAAGQARFLGNDLLLVDAGDYDGDGRSELLFRKSGYDYDGYVLYADDFAKAAEFGWNYH